MNAQTSAADQAQYAVPKVGARLIRKYPGLLASLGFAAFLSVSAPALATLAVAPQLGTAAGYTVLGTNPTPIVGTVTCVSSGPLTTITGNVGSTFTSITPGACTITGTVTAPVLGSVVTDFNSAYSDLNSLNPTCDAVIPIVTSTLAPGVYCSAAGTTIGAGVIFTLSGTASDIWVFKVGTGGTGALTGNSFTVTMGGTAKDYNVYWWTKEAATLTDSTFKGTILSGTDITTTRTNYVGRVMAKTDVTVTNGPMTFAAPPPMVTVTKISNGGVGTFNFTGDNGFASPSITTATSGVGVAGATQTLTLAGVVTTITESVPPAGFTLASIACTGLGAGGIQTPNIGARSVTLDANATAVGAAIACTFTNTFHLPPTLGKVFLPATISAGGVSRLTITLTNPDAAVATLTTPLIDTLPGGVSIAPTPTASTTCGGGATASATAGGSTVTLSSGSTIPATGSCTMSVNVTAPAGGPYTNTLAIGALATSNGSNAATANAILTISGVSATTTLSTVASPGVTLGGTISDTATLSGGTAPTGTITFNLYGPNDTTCTGAVTSTSTVTVNSGNAAYLSPSFTPVAAGTYRWIANYGGDSNNLPTANVCNAANESVIVTAVIPGGSAASIPTLSEWAMIMLVALLAFTGIVSMRRQTTR